MKENWERTKPFYEMKANEIEEMFHSFMPESKLRSFQLLGGGLSNLNYKLQVESCENPFILRISNERNCKIESSLHCKLHRQLPVPEIYYSKYQGNRSYSVMEWKKGVHLKEIMYGKDVRAIKQSGFSVGYWLSKIGESKFIKSGFFNKDLKINEPLKITPDTFLMFMKEFLIDGQTSRWLGNDLTRKLWKFCNLNKYLLNNIDDTPPSLVHSDYNGLNILVSEMEENHEVTGIIDWEFAFAGPVYFDIGNMLRYENFDHFSDFEKAFIEGLQSNGITLPHNWKRISKLVDLISLCGLLNHKRVGENRVKDINQLIIHTMKNWNEF